MSAEKLRQNTHKGPRRRRRESTAAVVPAGYAHNSGDQNPAAATFLKTQFITLLTTTRERPTVKKIKIRLTTVRPGSRGKTTSKDRRNVTMLSGETDSIRSRVSMIISRVLHHRVVSLFEFLSRRIRLIIIVNTQTSCTQHRFQVHSSFNKNIWTNVIYVFSPLSFSDLSVSSGSCWRFGIMSHVTFSYRRPDDSCAAQSIEWQVQS